MSNPAEERFLRFSVSDRLEHWAQILTFIPLALTGLVQRYPGSGLSQRIIDALGGIEAVRIIHRWFAAFLMVAVVYHLGAIGYRRFVLGIPRAMGPTRADFTAARQAVEYILGRRESRPQQGRYTFEEKLEYWSLVWGTALMVATGFMLWNPIATATVFPGSFIPAAKAAHGGEAVLAVLAVVVWHLYHVHVRDFNTSMFTGYLPFEDMQRDHALELAARAAPAAADPPPPEELRRRRRRYLPLYSSGALAMLAGIWLFVSFESTAIETIEPLEDPVVFAPTSTSTSTSTTTTAVPTTPAPTGTVTTTPAITTEPAALAWTNFAPSFAAACGACHGEELMLGGLSLASYDAALAGGASGPGIVPGEPDAGTIVDVQTTGDHPGQLTDAELADLRSWIASGAAEG